MPRMPSASRVSTVTSAPRRPATTSVILCLFALACNSSDDPTQPAMSSPFAGVWSGTTSQGEPISFTVAGSTSALELVAADLRLQMPDAVPPTSGPIVVCFSSDGRLDLTLDGAQHPFEGTTVRLRLPDDIPATQGALSSGFLELEATLETESQARGMLVAEAPLPLLNLPCAFRGETTFTAFK